MKSTEKVLLAIQVECSKQKKLAEISCFEKIARQAGVSPQNLPVFLSELQEKGFIKYSVASRFIYLTQEGKEFSSRLAGNAPRLVSGH